MKTINQFTGKIVLGLAAMLAPFNSALAECPAHLQKQIDAALAATLPAGWSNSMASLDLIDPSDDPRTISISPNTSLVTSTKEFQDYAVKYKYTVMGIDPTLDPSGALMNYTMLQGEAIDRAQRHCNMIGLANQRIRELIDANQTELNEYLKSEWLDFTANSLKVSGTVILYTTGVGKVLQVAKGVRVVFATQDAILKYGAITQNLISYLNKLYRNEKMIQPFLARMADELALAKSLAEQERILKALNAMTALGRNKIAQLTAAEAKTKLALSSNLEVLVGTTAAVQTSVAMEAYQACSGACDLTTTVLLGGNVWKQFAGYRNPYEETINITLENKKKFVQEFKEDIAVANKYRQSADAERVKLVRLSQTPPASNIFYGGFSVTLPY